MHWVATSEKDLANDALEKRLWNAADQFRANSGLTAAQYSAPVLGLIFLLFAETRFAQRRAQLLPSPLAGEGPGERGSRRAGNRGCSSFRVQALAGSPVSTGRRKSRLKLRC